MSLDDSFRSADNQLVVDDRRENHKRMTIQQMIELEKFYDAENPTECRLAEKDERRKIAEKLDLNERQVYQWYYRRVRGGMSAEELTREIVLSETTPKSWTTQKYLPLKEEYESNPTSGRITTKSGRKEISEELGLTEQQVYMWYRNHSKKDGHWSTNRSRRGISGKFFSLREEYESNPTSGRITTTSGRKEIAEELGLTETQVYFWYYNHSRKDGNWSHRSKNTRYYHSRFKDWQKEILMTHFEIDQNPLGQDLKKLISRTKLRRRQVYHWFREERKRRENREAPELDVWQEEMLESFFETNAHPSPDERTKLADDTELNERQVNAWFKNRRNVQMEITNEKKDITDVSDDEDGDADNGEVDDSGDDTNLDDRISQIEIKVENIETDESVDIDYDSEEMEDSSSKDQIEDWQKCILSAHWKKTQNPSGQLLDKIVKQTKLKKLQIHFWFRRERNCLRETAKEAEESSRRSLRGKAMTQEQKDILNDAFELPKYPCQGEKNKLLRKVFKVLLSTFRAVKFRLVSLMASAIILKLITEKQV